MCCTKMALFMGCTPEMPQLQSHRATHHILMLILDGPIASNAEPRCQVHDPWQRVCSQPMEQCLAFLELYLNKEHSAVAFPRALHLLREWCMSLTPYTEICKCLVPLFPSLL